MTTKTSRKIIEHELNQLKSLLSPHQPVYALLRKSGKNGHYYTFHAAQGTSGQILNISYAVATLLGLRWTNQGHVYNCVTEDFDGPSSIIAALSVALFRDENALEWRTL